MGKPNNILACGVKSGDVDCYISPHVLWEAYIFLDRILQESKSTEKGLFVLLFAHTPWSHRTARRGALLSGDEVPSMTKICSTDLSGCLVSRTIAFTFNVPDPGPKTYSTRIKGSDSDIVIADFGMWRQNTCILQKSSCTPLLGLRLLFVLNKKGHEKAVDVWSTGIITYGLALRLLPISSRKIRGK
ncbi:hypothetical protein BU15DRAFT_65165 [Melanogaster broomeanus]|nr:hypothetical protein BU15DRAFT_65165 [Melanogaster broomeanus]